MSDTTTPAWRPLLNATTPWAVLDSIIDAQIQIALTDLRAQLAADTDLSEQDRTTLLAYAEPTIRRQTRANIEAAWTQLQVEATSGITH